MAQLELSPIDYVYSAGTFAPISFTLRYDTKLDPERVVEAFRASARRFLGVAGVFAQRDPNTLYIDLSRDAAVIEVCDEATAKPFATEAEKIRNRIGEPLARARVTRLTDGGTALALALAHGVGDGYSFFLFLVGWAAAARGENSVEPACARSVLNQPEARASVGRRWSGELEHAGFYIDGEDVTRATLSWKSVALPQDVFAAKGERNLSSNDLLSAALWKNHVRPEQRGPTTFCTLADLRRFRSDLGPLFFGNAILPVKVEMDAEKLRSSSQVDVADRIRSAVAMVPSRIEAGMAELETLRLSAGTAIFQRVRPTDPHGITLTNMSRVPYSALDFGAGLPTAAEPGLAAQVDPCIAVFPDALQGGLRVTTTF